MWTSKSDHIVWDGHDLEIHTKQFKEAESKWTSGHILPILLTIKAGNHGIESNVLF